MLFVLHELYEFLYTEVPYGTIYYLAVIGYTTSTDEQVARESKIVEQLVHHNQHIVSGLAKGCNGIAHTVCMDCGGKTVAILPSPLNSIFPAAHRDMAEHIATGTAARGSEGQDGYIGRHYRRHRSARESGFGNGRYTILSPGFIPFKIFAHYFNVGQKVYVFMMMTLLLFSDYWTTVCPSWRHKMVGVLYQFCIHHLVSQMYLIR